MQTRNRTAHLARAYKYVLVDAGPCQGDEASDSSDLHVNKAVMAAVLCVLERALRGRRQRMTRLEWELIDRSILVTMAYHPHDQTCWLLWHIGCMIRLE